jgi:predicted Rossmann fold flavoprotein
MKKSPDIAIVGGGAAGLVAAITAARLGSRVTLLERQDRVGRKLLATGNGRCNLASAVCSPDNYHGADPRFVASVLRQFSVEQTLAFFQALGLCTREEEGRIYPLTGQSSTVLDVLRFEAERLGVTVRPLADVTSIARRGAGFLLGWSGGDVQVDLVVVATGGKAAPHLGGTDSGILLLEKLGHTAQPIFAALVPLKTSSRFGRQLKGVKVFARAALEIAGQPGRSDEGEVLFSEYGLSGIPILQLSESANRARLAHQPVRVALDFFPAWGAAELQRHLDERFAARPDAPLELALVGIVHKRLIPVVLQEVGVADAAVPAGRVPRPALAALARLLKAWTFEVTGSLSWRDAQVMAGGLSTSEFVSETLESRLVPGIFAAGEVLDVCGDCGGHNLQWAWSSGAVAGLHAAQV